MLKFPKFWWLKKKPRVHRIVKVWSENGVDCWLVPYEDFNRLYSGENVIETVESKVCGSLTFAGNPVIVYRQEKPK